MVKNILREHYIKPEILKHGNLKEITFTQPDFSCSVKTNNGNGNGGCDNGNH